MSMDASSEAAIRDARTRALIRLEEPQRTPHDGDPDSPARRRLAALARVSPGPGTASGLLATSNMYVVALDADTLEPTSAPFPSFSAAADHFSLRPYDGAGLQLGAQPGGGTLVACRATAAGWAAWLAENGTEAHEREDDNGRTVDRSYRDPGRHARVHWSPPAVAARVTAVAIGRSALWEEGEKVRTDRAGVGEVGWVAWSIGAAWSLAGKGGLRLAFADRLLGAGVTLLATGILPMAAQRADGWFLSSTGVPVTLSPTDVPAWIIGAFAGKWVAA